jgi:hypothetical protein
MKGRTEENIRDSIARMHRVAEAVFNQELEVIPTYVEHTPPENANKAIYCLAEAIKKMSEADYFIGVGYSEVFKGCRFECEVAAAYGIRSFLVDVVEMMPDAAHIEQEFYNQMRSGGSGRPHSLTKHTPL